VSNNCIHCYCKTIWVDGIRHRACCMCMHRYAVPQSEIDAWAQLPQWARMADTEAIIHEGTQAQRETEGQQS